jgi:hypothetical protein
MSALSLRETLKAKNAPSWEEARRNGVMRPPLDPLPADAPHLGGKRLTIDDVTWITPHRFKRVEMIFSLTTSCGRLSKALHRDIGPDATVMVGLMGEDTLVIKRVPAGSGPPATLVTPGGGQVGAAWLAEALHRAGWTPGRYAAVRAREDVWTVSRSTRVALMVRPKRGSVHAQDE